MSFETALYDLPTAPLGAPGNLASTSVFVIFSTIIFFNQARARHYGNTAMYIIAFVALAAQHVSASVSLQQLQSATVQHSATFQLPLHQALIESVQVGAPLLSMNVPIFGELLLKKRERAPDFRVLVAQNATLTDETAALPQQSTLYTGIAAAGEDGSAHGGTVSVSYSALTGFDGLVGDCT
jgi:hypothetical protein